MKSPLSVVAVAALLCLALQAGEKPVADAELAKLLPGKWRGVHTAGGGAYHHLIQIRKHGPGWIGQEVLWGHMTEKQAMAATMKRLNKKGLQRKAIVIIQQYAITLKDGDLTLNGLKAQSVLGGKYNTDSFLGKLKAPGILTGEAKDAKGAGGTFQFWKEGILDKPIRLDLAKGKTHKLGCIDGGKYNYRVYIPKSYDPAKPAPLLLNFSPGGNAQPLSTKKAEELGWIMAGLVESKNGPLQPSVENRDAVLFDLRRRLNIDTRRVYFSGFSGGSRAASLSAVSHTEMCAGIICIGAGYLGGVRPTISLPVFFIVGKTDSNHKEVTGLYPSEKRAGRPTQMIIHPGGHSWGRKQDHEAAIDWLQARAGK